MTINQYPTGDYGTPPPLPPAPVPPPLGKRIKVAVRALVLMSIGLLAMIFLLAYFAEEELVVPTLILILVGLPFICCLWPCRYNYRQLPRRTLIFTLNTARAALALIFVTSLLQALMRPRHYD